MKYERLATADFTRWREQARRYLTEGVPPENTIWNQDLQLFQETVLSLKPMTTPKAPIDFFKWAQLVSCARDDQRWALLYRLLYRLNHENSNLLKITVDPDVQRAFELAKSVRRDIHKMHAFVRFKKVLIEDTETYVAWHQPEHLTIELGAPFFVRRFGDKPWSIFTPDASAHWDMQRLTFAEGLTQKDFQHRDEFDELWKTYYRSIYNPTRLKIKMMKSEMAPKYWSSLPETEIIHELIRNTPKRLQNIRDVVHYQAAVPAHLSWHELREKAKTCAACPLAQGATQTVFGEGPQHAKLMIVGEQPSHDEGLQGQAFVGPAGEMLSEALKAAGLSREKIYVTHAVKHFKWAPGEQQTKWRKHTKASGAEMQACKPWLEAEISLIKPKVILALGATAGLALYGRLVKIQDEIKRVCHTSPFAQSLLISWHPVAILQAPNAEEKQQRFQDLVESLKRASEDAL